jgi:hypothetical protein
MKVIGPTATAVDCLLLANGYVLDCCARHSGSLIRLEVEELNFRLGGCAEEPSAESSLMATARNLKNECRAPFESSKALITLRAVTSPTSAPIVDRTGATFD